MTTKQAFIEIAITIQHLYPVRESESIAAIVLEDAFGIKKHGINQETHFDENQQLQLRTILQRLLAHEPVQYVMGKTIFFGFPFRVDKNVLIPRQETEELVALAIETLRQTDNPVRLLDIGTGSGCIPISIKKGLPALEVHSLDVSATALEVAKGNAALNQADVLFHEVDILDENAWASLPRFDLIVSNPPYITEKEKWFLEKNVIEYEPHLALFAGGDDAQRFVKKIALFASQHLSRNGYLLLETNEYFAPASKEVLAENGFVALELRKDLNGRDRMLRGKWPG